MFKIILSISSKEVFCNPPREIYVIKIETLITFRTLSTSMNFYRLKHKNYLEALKTR